MLKALKEDKILGFPVWMFIIVDVIMIFLARMDWLLTDMVGALAFALSVGTLLGWIGDHIPVWNTWFGGGMLFTCLCAGAMNTFGLVGEKTIEALNTFNGSTGFLNLYILVLITGSVLSIDRKLLIKSFAGYIPWRRCLRPGSGRSCGRCHRRGRHQCHLHLCHSRYGRRQRRRHHPHVQDVRGCHRQ